MALRLQRLIHILVILALTPLVTPTRTEAVVSARQCTCLDARSGLFPIQINSP